MLPALGILIGVGTWRGVVLLRESLGELHELEARRDRLAKGNEKLAREVEALEREREAKVHAARETLDVAAPGEVLVLVTGSPTAVPRAPSAAPVSAR